MVAEDVLDEVIQFACKLSKHRNSRQLQKEDVKFAFERRFKVKLPQKLHELKETQTGVVQVLPQTVTLTGNYRNNLLLVKKEVEKGAQHATAQASISNQY